jgi:hypothetical protein
MLLRQASSFSGKIPVIEWEIEQYNLLGGPHHRAGIPWWGRRCIELTGRYGPRRRLYAHTLCASYGATQF